jgi:hypothetical protein
MVVHLCNPSTQEAEVGGLGVQGQPGQHSETLSKTQPKRKKKGESLQCALMLLSVTGYIRELHQYRAGPLPLRDSILPSMAVCVS